MTDEKLEEKTSECPLIKCDSFGNCTIKDNYISCEIYKQRTGYMGDQGAGD